MKKIAVYVFVIAALMACFVVNAFGDEAPATVVPTATPAPEGVVLDSSIVFAILILAAGIGVAGGYWFAKRR